MAMEVTPPANKKAIAGCFAAIFLVLVGVTYAVVEAINFIRQQPPPSEKIARVQEERERERLRALEERKPRQFPAEAHDSVAQKRASARTSPKLAGIASLPKGGQAEVPLVSVTTEYAILGASYPPGKPNPLSTQKPVEIVHAPAGENIHYGRIPLGEQPVWFAIAPQKAKGQKARLFVDRNRDGNFANDKPASYEGTGTSLSAGVLTVDIERGDGSSFPYAIWLWTTFDGDNLAAKHGFNFYSRSYKRGAMRLPDGSTVSVYAGDPKNIGMYDDNKVLIDWNNNRKPEQPEWMVAGQSHRKDGTTLKLIEIAPFADTVRFEVNPIGVADVTDVADALSREAIAGNPPPELGVDLQGRDIKWYDYRGKVVLVDFWATWCAPCIREMPSVKEAYAKLHDRGFEIIGVSLDKDKVRFSQYIEKEQIAWRQVSDFQSWNSPIAKRWRVDSIPATFLIGKDGKIAQVGVRGEMLLKAIEAELAK